MSLALPFWCRIWGEFPESWWSSVYVRIPKKYVLSQVKECVSNRLDEHARESEARPAKSKTPFFMGFYGGELPPESLAKFGLSLLTSDDPVNISQEKKIS